MIRCPYNCGFYREDINLLLCHPKGELTANQMNDISICRECIQKAGLLQVNRFHDLTDITSINLGFEDVRHISVVEAKLREPTHPILACYLVPNPVLFGTIRMYASLIERGGVIVHVSYKLQTLADILGVDRSMLSSGS
jgi:hypothetical protein